MRARPPRLAYESPPSFNMPEIFRSDIADLGTHADRGSDLVPALADYSTRSVPYLFLAEGHYESEEEEDEAEH